MIAALVVLCVILAAVAIYAIAYALHEVKWTRRERQVRWGGPADKSLADRLAEYAIDAEHPDEMIQMTNPKEG